MEPKSKKRADARNCVVLNHGGKEVEKGQHLEPVTNAGQN